MNHRSLIYVASIAALTLGACKGGGKASKPEPKPIGDSGFVVDAPASWKVDVDMKDFYTVTSDHKREGWVQVMVVDGAGIASLDGLVQSTECADPAKAIKQTTPTGTLYVQCEGTGGTIDGKPVMVTKIAAVATTASRHATCQISTDKNIEAAAAVCKSLRKK